MPAFVIANHVHFIWAAIVLIIGLLVHYGGSLKADATKGKTVIEADWKKIVAFVEVAGDSADAFADKIAAKVKADIAQAEADAKAKAEKLAADAKAEAEKIAAEKAKFNAAVEAAVAAKIATGTPAGIAPVQA